MSIRRATFRIAGVLAATWWVTVSSAPGRGATVSWTDDSGGSYYDSSNWDPARVPNSSDVASYDTGSIFDVGNAYTVDFPRRLPFPPPDPVNMALQVRNDQVTFDLNGRTYRVTNTGTAGDASVLLGFSDRVSRGNHGSLTVTDGELVGVNAVLGRAGALSLSAANHGELHVRSGGELALSGDLYVGFDRRGTLIIDQGGTAAAQTWLGYNEDAEGDATVTGSGSVLNSSLLTVGSSGDGLLTVASGGLVANTGRAYLGSFAGSSGTVIVQGAGARLTSSDIVVVGDAGEGALTIEQGATVECPPPVLGNASGGTGEVIITGAGSRWSAVGTGMAVGNAGRGTLELVDGASLLTGGTSTLGKSAGGEGTALISGVGTNWLSTSILVGGAGHGTLTIEQGATVTSINSATIGEAGTGVGEVTVQGIESAWSIDLGLTVGDSGAGYLAILDGGRIASGDAWIAARLNAPGTGSAYVLGVESRWEITRELVVGGGGGAGVRSGTLLIGAGGNVMNHDAMIAAAVSSTGTVEMDGANTVWTSAGSLYVGGNADGAGGLGTLAISHSARVEVADELRIWNTGGVALDDAEIVAGTVIVSGGSLAGDGTIHGHVANAGQLIVGDPIGRLVIDGDFSQSFAGHVKLEIAGAAAGNYDVLQVTGVATLGGEVDVMFVDDYSPQAGDSFSLLEFGSATGTFLRLNLPDLAEGLNWQTSSFAGDGNLTVIVDLLGDTNADGRVDLEDLNNVRNNFGEMSMPILGDTDGDFDVDLVDLNNVRNNFGASEGPSQSVPEPCGLLLALAAAAACGCGGMRAAVLMRSGG